MHSDHRRHYYCKALSWCWVFIYFICRVVFDARNEIVVIEQMWTSHCPHAQPWLHAPNWMPCWMSIDTWEPSHAVKMHTMHISVCTGRRFVGEFQFFFLLHSGNFVGSMIFLVISFTKRISLETAAENQFILASYVGPYRIQEGRRSHSLIIEKFVVPIPIVVKRSPSQWNVNLSSFSPALHSI